MGNFTAPLPFYDKQAGGNILLGFSKISLIKTRGASPEGAAPPAYFSVSFQNRHPRLVYHSPRGAGAKRAVPRVKILISLHEARRTLLASHIQLILPLFSKCVTPTRGVARVCYTLCHPFGKIKNTASPRPLIDKPFPARGTMLFTHAPRGGKNKDCSCGNY